MQLTKSGEHAVTLKAVTRNQSGRYQCEVSADAPLFHTATSTATMFVAQLPESEPTMTIYGPPATKDGPRRVALGDTFRAACVSGPSHPPVNFTWVINGIRQLVRDRKQTITVILLTPSFSRQKNTALQSFGKFDNNHNNDNGQ